MLESCPRCSHPFFSICAVPELPESASGQAQGPERGAGRVSLGHLLQGPAVSEGEKHPKLLSARAPQGDMSKLGCRESCGEVLEGLKSSHKLQAPQSPRMMEATLKHSCGTGATPTTHNTCGSRLPVTGCGGPRTAKGLPQCALALLPGPCGVFPVGQARPGV